MAARVSIQIHDFNLSDEIAALRSDDKRLGAVCSFVGTVRDRNMAPTLPAARGSVPPEGAEPARGGPSQRSAPTLPAARGSLPPEGAEPARGSPSQRSAQTLPAAQGSVPPDVPAAVLSMELEHYPGMTEKAIEAMIDEALERFDIFGARVVHRVGLLQPLDQVVMVAVTSAHRGESFQACEFLMDYLKTQAPFWKKEQTFDGAQWVDARVSDDAAIARWGIAAGNADCGASNPD